MALVTINLELHELCITYRMTGCFLYQEESLLNISTILTRRGRRLAAPVLTGDPWGYYAEHRESRHMEADRSLYSTSY